MAIRYFYTMRHGDDFDDFLSERGEEQCRNYAVDLPSSNVLIWSSHAKRAISSGEILAGELSLIRKVEVSDLLGLGLKNFYELEDKSTIRELMDAINGVPDSDEHGLIDTLIAITHAEIPSRLAKIVANEMGGFDLAGFEVDQPPNGRGYGLDFLAKTLVNHPYEE